MVNGNILQTYSISPASPTHHLTHHLFALHESIGLPKLRLKNNVREFLGIERPLNLPVVERAAIGALLHNPPQFSVLTRIF